MQKLCYVLLIISIVFATIIDAGTTGKTPSNTAVSELTPSEFELASRLLLVKQGNGISKRYLRGTADSDAANLLVNDEERAIKIPQSVKDFFTKLRWKNLKAAWLKRTYERLDRKGVTPDKLDERLRPDLSNSKRRNKRLAANYRAWWEKKHN